MLQRRPNLLGVRLFDSGLQQLWLQFFHSFIVCLLFFFGASSAFSQTVSSVIRKNQFNVSNHLRDYIRELPQGFTSSLSQLRPTDTWIDLGGGKGNAVEDYLQSSLQAGKTPARVVLVTYSLPRIFGLSSYGGRLQILKGRLFEDIPDSEIPRARLITDVMGVISYTRDLTLTLQKVFDHLEIHGELYISSSNPSTMIDTSFGPISLTKFLSRVPGLLIDGYPGTLHIVKQQERIVIPKLELTRIDEAERPFFRRFILR